ncbi:hypothetical protein [Acinetobacter nectaris]|uniref:hypothetical protein n=1 Tax=Acinetobacter nectaris TaxID=1219382 RepID=UPI001F2043A6|nr:hypothetical protein [Acinetobacter nectaris]MCF8999269.1 hypothetical protein [Acinetobacter nectaris]MCF9028124.1 hypothetical protein [Acinetobacter nectaris]
MSHTAFHFQCHQCGLTFERFTVCTTCKTDYYMLNLNNPMDCFIANGSFDRALHQVNQAAKAADHEKTNS